MTQLGLTPNDQVRVERIYIKNVFGVQKLEFDPNGVTVIRGDNDTGKTSVLRAISLLLGGGHNPEALHRGAEKGEVRFEMDDGTEVYSRLTENDTYHRVEKYGDAFDGNMSARDILESIQDEISVNPVRILQARPKDRGQILLEAMPMTIGQDKINDATEVLSTKDWGQLPHLDLDGHALEVLGDKSSGAIGTLYEKRQEMHGAKRDKQGTVNDLQEAVGDHDDPEDLKEERDHIQKELQNMRAQKQDALDEVNNWEKAEIEKIRHKANEKRDSVREEHDDKIREQEAERERLNERIEQAERAEQTVETLEERKKELAELEDRYERLTEAIENLRSLRTDFQEDLPEGVSLDDDGEIVDEEGTRFEYWNEQAKVDFAMRIAEMRKGRLGIIPLDGIGSIVGEQREALIRFASQSDAQFVLTEARPGEDLTIDHP